MTFQSDNQAERAFLSDEQRRASEDVAEAEARFQSYAAEYPDEYREWECPKCLMPLMIPDWRPNPWRCKPCEDDWNGQPDAD